MKLLIQLLAVCLLLSCAVSASAAMRYVPPGSVPVLAPDEGLLVLDVDTTAPLEYVRIRRDGKMFGYDTPPFDRGRSSVVYVATAGPYHLDAIKAYDFDEFDYRDGKTFHFEVKPGVINYPGDLIYRPATLHRAIIRVSNRGLRVIDELHARYGELGRRYPFFYTGFYPDPFPGFYEAARAAQPAKTDQELDTALPVPDPGKLPIAVEDLWRYSRVQEVSLSPGGDLLAEVIYEKEAWHVDLIDLKASTVLRLFDAPSGVSDVLWAGPRVLAVNLHGPRDGYENNLIRIDDTGPNGRTFTKIRIPRPGVILDTLPDSPDHVLFESRGPYQSVAVYALDIESPETVDYFNAPRVDRGVSGAVRWLSDGNGHLRAEFARKGSDLILYYGDSGAFKQVLNLDDKGYFDPLALSADGKLLYGLSDKDRQQRDLVSFDPATRTLSTIFSKPGIDIEEAVFGTHHRLIGAAYHRGGQRAVEYFGQTDRGLAETIQRAFPDSSVEVVDRDDAGRQLILAVEKSDQPARYYHLDVDTRTASLLDETAPWLDDKPLAPSQVVHATGSDGMPIEAYLTLPLHAIGKSPLIVYSHGGPIGVRDSIEFDPAVQLFASMGYAVLQVNFRGSDGYGRAFREAAQHHYGSLIEDDIDAATQVVLQNFPIDRNRLCAVGASYGGFSALVSAIRWPQRFRCAVSIAGLSDLLLFFTSSDTSQSEEGRKTLVTAIGDPLTEADMLRRNAPVYRYQDLTVPVMLAHGTDDERVDYEHTRRLVRMLNLAGRPPVVMAFNGEGHGGFDAKNEIALWKGVAGFLRAHLDTTAPVPVSTLQPAMAH